MENQHNARFNKDEIIAQLTKIYACRPIRETAVLQRLLWFMVTETIEGRADEVNGHSIALVCLQKVYGDYRDLILLKMYLFRLRKILANYYNQEGRHDVLLIVFTPGSYIPVFKKRIV